MAVILTLSLAVPAPAQGFFPGDAPAPDIGLAAEPTGFAQAAPIGAAVPVMGTSVLGLGVLLGLAAAAGAGGDGGDGGGGGEPVVLNGCRTENAGRSAFETAEYAGNVGLQVICASDRYARSSALGDPALGFGRGVTVAIFDDGFYTFHPDLRENFDGVPFGDGYTEFGDREPGDYPDFRRDGNHGTHVAGIVGASRNGSGMHGVAPEVTLVGYRGLSSYASPREDFTGVEDEDPFNLILADGIGWALGRGAEVMNHSWGFVNGLGNSVTLIDRGSYSSVAEYLGPTAMQAFTDSVAAGMVHVFAAGNSSLSQPTVFAGLPYFGEEFGVFDDQIVAVVSVDPDGTISDFSNRCGVAADHCLAAPGGSILSTVARRSDDGEVVETYEELSGTSMAAPHVSGAIALLLSEFPEITASEAVTILKDTARDDGIYANSAIYGHGLLNLEGAMQPVGTMAIQLASTIGADARPVAASGVVAQGAVARSLAGALGAQRMIVTDSFARGFSVDPGAFVTEADDSGALLDRATDFATSAGKVLRHADATGEVRFSPWGAEALAPTGTLGEVHAPQISVLDGSAAMAVTAPLGAGLTGTFQFAGPTGGSGSGPTEARYLGGTLALALGGGAEITLGAGLLREEGGFLGADLEGGFGGAVEAETAFLSLGAALDLGGSALRLSYTDGTTGFTGDGLLRGGSDVGTRSLGLSWETGVAGGGRLGLGLRRTLDVTGGTLDVMMPVARVAAVGPVASSGVVMAQSALPLDPAAAPTDLEFRYTVPAGAGRVGLAVTHRVEDGTTVAGLGYRMRF